VSSGPVVLRSAVPAPAARKGGSGVVVSAGYNGASGTRSTLKAWNPFPGSADSDTLVDLPTLRARSRDLVRNNPLALGAISTLANYAVGTGLAVQPKIDREALGLSPEEASTWQRKAERAFWACADCLDVERTLTFRGLQVMVFRSSLESGDAFTLRRYVPRRGDIIGTKVQVIEGDRVCNPRGVYDSPRMAAGVERDLNGAPVAYHVLQQHPGDVYFRGGIAAQEWKRIPAFDEQGGRLTLHHYRKVRPGQTRGVSVFAPVIELVLQLGRYGEAEVAAAVINAFYTVFFTNVGETTNPDTGEFIVEEPETPGVDPETEVELGVGTQAELAGGEDVKFADPHRPNVNYGAFAEAITKQIAIGVELPYEVLMKHFNSSYSASRAALLDAWKTFMGWRVWMVETFCQPSYEMVITELVARGILEAPGFFEDPFARRAWLSAEWVGDAMGQLDPLKEAKAIETRLKCLVTTLQEETGAYSGKDWEQNLEQRAREVEKAAELGLQADNAEDPATDPLVTDPEPATGGR
jgi:lambda family phage portal protein